MLSAIGYRFICLSALTEHGTARDIEVQTAEQALMELRQAHLDLRTGPGAVKHTTSVTNRVYYIQELYIYICIHYIYINDIQ